MGLPARYMRTELSASEISNERETIKILPRRSHSLDLINTNVTRFMLIAETRCSSFVDVRIYARGEWIMRFFLLPKNVQFGVISPGRITGVIWIRSSNLPSNLSFGFSLGNWRYRIVPWISVSNVAARGKRCSGLAWAAIRLSFLFVVA